ncbi:hypothetical protein LCGC14_3082800 [marine sediment metagenome]|uniref:Uncharacterized protein n=1 Tax=marine sediment metagenome TaxID=412755 RepID=A0A0F8WDM3_9ZZZZ
MAKVDKYAGMEEGERDLAIGCELAKSSDSKAKATKKKR